MKYILLHKVLYLISRKNYEQSDLLHQLESHSIIEVGKQQANRVCNKFYF